VSYSLSVSVINPLSLPPSLSPSSHLPTLLPPPNPPNASQDRLIGTCALFPLPLMEPIPLLPPWPE
jgi:hypothetical protein